MPHIAPIPWKRLECVFLKAGFEFFRQTGSHRFYVKKGLDRPVVIPAHSRPVMVSVIQNNLRTAKMDRSDYFRYLEEC